ncbi:MAG TPA: histidinol-phosphatase [Sphingomonas sp.]|uniref:histidinol-phosphatase n=1 Tax=Sphingomonas sp. TaxID=28214 RepID=UPI002ED88A71
MTDDDILLASALADAAGAAIRPFFRARFAIETKSDASPVTQADRAAERAIRDLLALHAPADGIVGEEYGRERAGADRVWVLDPIDGTRAFIAGRPIFGTLIALLEQGKPMLGIIDQPISGERWVGAAGRPTTLSGQVVTTRSCPTLADALLATTSPWLFDAAGGSVFDRVRGSVRDTLLGGDCYNYGLLAAGHGDIVLEQGLQLYDFAALVPVVEGAGGLMRDWRGGLLDADSDGAVVAVGDPSLLDPMLALLG